MLRRAPDRLVYEVTTHVTGDYAIRGNHWSSGVRRVIIDAQAGDSLASQAVGNMTRNVGALRAQHLRLYPKAALKKQRTPN